MSELVSPVRGTLAAGLLALLLAATPHAMAGGAPATSAPAAPSLPQPPTAPALAAPAAPPDASEDIRDIRGAKYIWPAWLLPALIAAAVLLAFAIYAIVRWQRRRRAPRILSLSERALQHLEEIRGLMQPATAREFSIAASDIVRLYIEQRFDVTATHRTTEEFLHDLLDSSHPSLARHRGLLSEFLNQCDLAKFAGMSLTTQSMESLHQSARAFVLETAKPDPPPPPHVKEAHDPLPST